VDVCERPLMGRVVVHFENGHGVSLIVAVKPRCEFHWREDVFHVLPFQGSVCVCVCVYLVSASSLVSSSAMKPAR
jgi:hypothetical protein